MARPIGYHLVKSAYGLWLPGDDRGSWSEAWDEQIGFCQPHTLNAGDPVRRRMAEERMKHTAVRFTDEMMIAIMESIRGCVAKSGGGLVVTAYAIEETHLHMALLSGTFAAKVAVGHLYPSGWQRLCSSCGQDHHEI